MVRQLSAIALALSLAATGCEKTDDATIEKWGHTQKGPAKLQKAFSDESIDASLSAHAAAVMLKNGRDAEVKAGFEAMSPSRRTSVVKALAPRLWETARIEKEMDRPVAEQIAAKDQLFRLRKYADPETVGTIDGYLIDWYAVPSYEARAPAGGEIGSKVLRTIGPAAAKKMISAANAIVAGPKNRISAELLLGLAATGSPDAVKYVLDIATMERNDPDLPNRATDALIRAYVRNDSLFDVIPAEPALGPNINQLAALVKNEKMPGHAANHAVDLIRAIGAPACVQPLVEMLGYPHRESIFVYVAAQNALTCGGPKAIQAVVRALPEGAYEQKSLHDSVVVPIAKLQPRAAVIPEVRALLDDPKLITKWVAIEALAELKSVEDKDKIAAVAKDSRKLTGYWGDQADVITKRPDPTLGARAKEIADGLK